MKYTEWKYYKISNNYGCSMLGEDNDNISKLLFQKTRLDSFKGMNPIILPPAMGK